MDYPDFTGFVKEEAEALLKEKGIAFSFVLTTSPRDDVGGSELRVVRQLSGEEGLILTLCRY